MSQLAELIRQTATALGIDPIDLGTAISYETAGTFDPLKRGPTTQWGQHRGLIQFGEPQARQFGVDWAHPLESQLGPEGAVAKYLRSTGVKPGMGMMDVYSAINAGGVHRYGASDAGNGGAPGTVADKVNHQMAGHRQKAEALLGNALNLPGAPANQNTVAAAPDSPEEQGGSPLGRLFASMAPAADAIAQPGGPTVATDSGFGANLAAQQGVEKAKALAAGLAPNVDAYLALGPKRKSMFG